MVFDRLENSSVYEALHPRLAAAFNYLRTTNLAQLEVGRHAIDGDDVFALVQEYQTKPDAEGFWESHRRYIDVQYVIAGSERMGYACQSTLTVRQPYDADRDLLIYDGHGDFLTVAAGSFTIFMPPDAHMPCLAVGAASKVRKVVIKVAV